MTTCTSTICNRPLRVFETISDDIARRGYLLKSGSAENCLKISGMSETLKPKATAGGGEHRSSTSPTHKNPRAWILRRIGAFAALMAILWGYSVWSGDVRILSGFTGSLSIEDRAIKILKENPLIDGHDDLLILIRALYQNHIYTLKFKMEFQDSGMRGHVDLPRLQAGMSGGAFWSAFMPCPDNGTNFETSNYAEGLFIGGQQCVEICTYMPQLCRLHMNSWTCSIGWPNSIQNTLHPLMTALRLSLHFSAASLSRRWL